MSACKPDKPDAARIADHSKAIFCEGFVLRETALGAFDQIFGNLRREFRLSDEELEPIIQLIIEIAECKSGAYVVVKPVPGPQRG
jgi:hypothetical protein